MANQRTYKKGEQIFKEGEKITHLHIIQSGSVTLSLSRGKKNLEQFHLSSGQVLGEGLFCGQTAQVFTALVTSESKVFEVPVEELKTQYDQSPNFIKFTIKSFAERLKQTQTEIKNLKSDKDALPCPPEAVPALFSALYFSLQKKQDGPDSFPWISTRTYAQRVFGQSPKKLEQALLIFAKLKLAELVWGTPEADPEAPEEIQEVKFSQWTLIEFFFEYYQNFFFRPGKQDLLKTDDLLFQALEILLRESNLPDQTQEKKSPAKKILIESQKFFEVVKAEIGIKLNQDHFQRFENRGVLLHRRSSGQATIEFDLLEIQQIFSSWRILKEIEKWNDKGFVDLNEVSAPKKKFNEGECPHCHAPIQTKQKFCMECGSALQGAA